MACVRKLVCNVGPTQRRECAGADDNAAGVEITRPNVSSRRRDSRASARGVKVGHPEASDGREAKDAHVPRPRHQAPAHERDAQYRVPRLKLRESWFPSVSCLRLSRDVLRLFTADRQKSDRNSTNDLKGGKLAVKLSPEYPSLHPFSRSPCSGVEGRLLRSAQQRHA